jgi:hypothetical protein
VEAESEYPDDTNLPAAQGTLFHSFAEMCVEFGFQPEDFPTDNTFIVDGHEVVYDDEMVEGMQEGLAYIEDNFQGDDWIVLVENRVKIEPWTLEEGGFGTSDLCAISVMHRRIVVFDWKYGLVGVSPKKNEQLIIYGLGCWETFARKMFGGDAKNIQVDIVVEQPRAPGGGGLWQTTMLTLLKFGKDIKDKAALTYGDNPPRIAGSTQCKYCKASVDCDEWAEFNISVFDILPEEMDENIEMGSPPKMPNSKFLTPERRSFLILHIDVMKKWVEKLTTQAMEDYEADLPVPNLKIVLGRRGIRAYRPGEEKDAKKYLVKRLGHKKAHTEKILSPAQAEKLIGKPEFAKQLKKFVTQKDPKRSLVPDTDNRKTLAPVVSMLPILDEL